MRWQVSQTWLTGIQECWLAIEQGLQDGARTLGLVDEVHGQTAWPFSWRLAGETLWSDPSHARAVLITTGALMLTLILWLLSLCRTKGRWTLRALGVLPVLLAPWPAAHLLFVAAVPTSFHHSNSDFSVASIVQGKRVYAQHCVQCHGIDARGDGSDAAQLRMWPPDLTGKLLWKRLEGELFWRVRHGMVDRHGQITMPGMGERLTDTETWAVLDYLQVLAAGTTLRQTGAWQSPVRLPRMTVSCRGKPAYAVSQLRGQFLRIAFAGAAQPLPSDDPRLVTLVLGADAHEDPECQTPDLDAPRVLAWMLGSRSSQLPGQQVLVDRHGWLRARSLPGQGSWSDDNLVCSTGNKGDGSQLTGAVAPGLEGLLHRMDADPVRPLRGTFPH
jgi:mono/diheme cytochrome c family protein